MKTVIFSSSILFSKLSERAALMRGLLLSALLLLLCACSNFSREFDVYSADSTILVSSDGSARVSETFRIFAKQESNYGGVYVDIPQRFIDAGNRAHWRDFSLLSTSRDGSPEYHFREQSLEGYSVYVGERRCRSCRPRFHFGLNTIRIDYRLGRLVQEDTTRQTLVLPAFMGSVHDRGAAKTILVTIPAGGTLRSSQGEHAGYDVTWRSPTELKISIPVGKADRTLPGIEIEYPVGTFLPATNAQLLSWWLSDHLLIFASLIGPAIAAIFIGFRLRRSYRLNRISWPDIDGKLIERTSPVLAAYLHFRWEKTADKPAFLASLCRLAIAKRLRISSLGEDAEVSDVLPYNARRKPGVKRPSLAFPLHVVLDRIRKHPSDNGNRSAADVFHGAGDELRAAASSEYLQKRGEGIKTYVWTFCVIMAVSAVVAYLSGLVLFSLAMFAIPITVMALITALLHPEKAIEIGGSSQAKSIFGIFVGMPFLLISSTCYVSKYPPSGDQLPYLAAICVDVAGSILVLAMIRLPTLSQIRIRANLQTLRRYMLGQASGQEMSVALYERYLPYAIAFDLEHGWSEVFDAWRQAKGIASYAPDWLSRPER